jgi:hypothetical protein
MEIRFWGRFNWHKFVGLRKNNYGTRWEIGSEFENHAFVLRYRKEPAGSSEAPARIRIDLEYVNTKQRWRYPELDQALDCIKEVVDGFQPTTSGPEAGRN